jgi:D-alanyl-D-alanine carboxypeptidase/D-alanyl-D-alanine-endopeptidase (penicillin-binding protein 4)
VFPRQNCILPVLILTVVVAFGVPEPAALAKDATAMTAAATAGLIANGGYAVEKNDRYIAARNLHTPYVPASIIKIATGLAALDILGPDFHFSTGFYLDAHDNLYIKGFGDPFLISEEVAAIVSQLKENGCTRINDIYLDDTAFQLPAAADGAGWSDNPYDALNSGLAVNFNTINIKREKSGETSAAEEQTPTLEVMKELAAGLEPGVHRINITRQKDLGQEVISRYAGELFRAFQQQENIPGSGVIARRQVPENLTPFYMHHSSKSLEDIIRPLMRYSNNFIANQIFLAAGAARYGYPATWEKGKQAMDWYLQQHSMAAGEIQIFEGSGISRKNRVSPWAMMQLLEAFKPYARLLPRKDDKLVKSGTLEGVYCYAGYFTDNQRLDSFVLMLNQTANNRDKVLTVLEGIYRAD